MTGPTSTGPTMTTSVEVATDPITAFTVFTEEVDCWWRQGPINFHDTSRTWAKRFEPGIGGRVMEVHDPQTGEGLELGRITAWEPGARLAWTSTIDDVAVEVRFEPSGDATVVSVHATIPDGGADRGTTSWLRMTPQWLPTWFAQRVTAPHEPLRIARLAVAVYYEKPVEAAHWLHDAFQLETDGALPERDVDAAQTWIEFRVGNALVILFKQTDVGKRGVVTHAPWIFVDDLDAHYAHARDHGARIVEEIWEHGVRAYSAADLEGNTWTFAQASPVMSAGASYPT
jgi:uncharacterized glyoxalase superfamily protein PhnB